MKTSHASAKASYLQSQLANLVNVDGEPITNARIQIIADGGKTKWINLSNVQVTRLFNQLCIDAEREHEAVK